jgi:hypothetical protein
MDIPIINLLQTNTLFETPKTIKNTLARKDKLRWIKTIRKELKSFLANQTWRNIKKKMSRLAIKFLKDDGFLQSKEMELTKSDR